MTTVDTLGSFKDAIAKAGPESQKLAFALRDLIAGVLADAYEVPWPKLKIVGYGIGPQKNTEHFCYIAPFGAHVNLGFNHGVRLSDPKGLLEGAGKEFRHVKISTIADVRQPALRSLLQAAIKERRSAAGGEGGGKPAAQAAKPGSGKHIRGNSTTPKTRR